MTFFSHILPLLNGLGIMAVLSIAYGATMRWHLPHHINAILLGILFGAGASISMIQPIYITEGIFSDQRTLFVGFAGAFLGPIGATMALLVSASSRIALGGIGIQAGVLGLTIAAIMGVAWNLSTRRLETKGFGSFLALGLAVSCGFLGATLLPYDKMIAVWSVSGPFVVPFNIAGALMFGTLIERERRLAQREAQLSSEAHTDALTGLMNRRSIHEQFNHLERRAPHVGSAVLIVDLDHFKVINDTFGHDNGDVVLQAVAKALQYTVRADDLVARLGGEEFLVVLANSDPVAAHRTAERIRAAVADLDLPEPLTAQPITTSVGGHWEAVIPTLEIGMKLADEALYRAKAAGRNRVVFTLPAIAA